MYLPAVVESCNRVLQWQSLIVDLDDRSIYVAGSRLLVSQGEFDLLSLLLRRRNLPMTKEAILVELFGSCHGRDSRQVDVFVLRLCRTLRAAGLAESIAVVPGRGYTILDDDRRCTGTQPRVDQLQLAA